MNRSVNRLVHRRQSLILPLLFLLLAGTAAWLQFGLLGGAAPQAAAEGDEPDYYIENFTSTGVNRFGEKYRLSAARLVHYPGAAEALLEQPRIVQYGREGPTRRIHAERGRLDDATAEVLLTGNVRVIENSNGADAAAAVTVRQMRVRLKGGRG